MATHNPARYDPVEHVTPDEAAQNKRRMAGKQAALHVQDQPIPGQDDGTPPAPADTAAQNRPDTTSTQG